VQTVRTPDMKTRGKLWKTCAERQRIALVPTMGALHEGHLTLVRAAQAGRPRGRLDLRQSAQFGRTRTSMPIRASWPRTATVCWRARRILLWAPPVDDVSLGLATNIRCPGVSEGLCGAARPGHFDGVATVVLQAVQPGAPDMALFGEKDWQQLAVIRRMARDLDLTRRMPTRILGVPTVREADGLAMSSRNPTFRRNSGWWQGDSTS
jgi:pantoate--beta-alanine ligase